MEDGLWDILSTIIDVDPTSSTLVYLEVEMEKC